MAVYYFALLRRHARVQVRTGRLQTQAFFDAGGEVRQVGAGLLELDGGGEESCGVCSGELGERFGERARVGDEVAQDAAHGCGGGVGAGLD